MKKTLSLLIMFLVSMTMMAGSVKVDFTKAPTKQSADTVIWQVDNVKFILAKGESKHDANEYVTEFGLKMYDDQIMTISTTDGAAISHVSFEDSPVEPTSTAPSFKDVQNCTAEQGWGYSFMTPTAEGCTMLGGTLTKGYTGYSHVISAEVEIADSNPGGNEENNGGNEENTGGNIGGGNTNTGDNINGGGESGVTVDSEAYRKMYLDFLNYRPKVLKNYDALTLYDETEHYCDVNDDKFNTQEECDALYAYLLERFNIIRGMVGDGPYTTDKEDNTPVELDFANLNSAIRRSGWFIDDLKVDSKYAEIQAELQAALDEAQKALNGKTQAEVDAATQALEAALLKAQNAKKDIDTPPAEPDENGTPMDPVAPNLSQYTHKVMVESYPRGSGVLNYVTLRDDAGRVVQKMSMSTRYSGLETVLTDSIRTYAYEGNKMIEDLSLPYYDENDQLHLEPMSRRVTSYYKLENGRKEIHDVMWLEGEEYVTRHRTIVVYDDQERKVAYKDMIIYGSGEDVLSDLTYTYTETGVHVKGENDYDGYIDRYEEYDANGNLVKVMDYRNDNTLTKYFFDSRNHNLGYATYKNYNPETGTCSKENEYPKYKVDEYYDDGGAKKAHTSGGYTKEYVRDGNTEIETLVKGYDTYRYRRTYDENGALIKKEQLRSSGNSVVRSYEYAFSNIKAENVLGALTTIDEEYRLSSDYGTTTMWNFEYPIIASHYYWAEYDDNEYNFYTIIPLEILPAQSTQDGISIPVGNAGDEVVMDTNGEIYLLDKGGKRRYSVSVAGITVSSESGKIFISAWNPVEQPSSVSMRKAPATGNINTDEYDIYIPENVITVNGKSLTELYVPIAVEDNEATAIVNVNNTAKATSTDGCLYNLQGMPVNNPANGQIVIMKGKKVIVK